MKLLNSNPTAFWGLVISAIVIVILGFSVWLVLMIKVKKIKNKVKADKIKEIKKINLSPSQVKTFYRLISEFEGKIDLATYEYLISTVSTNQYKNILINGKNDGLTALIFASILKLNVTLLKSEIENIKKMENFIKEYKILKSKINIKDKLTINDKFDFCLIEDFETDLNREFDNVWSKINKKGMVVLTQCKKLNKQHKELLRYLKLIDVRFEHWKINEGFIFIAK